MISIRKFITTKQLLNIIKYNIYNPSRKLCSVTTRTLSNKPQSCDNISRLRVELLRKNYFSSNSTSQLLDLSTFEKISEETLQSLTEYFEIITEDADIANADVTYSSGVLNVHLGEKYGTYVINRQGPNRQIWLSSPISGPKRYDFVRDGEYWIYKHTGESLHELLQNEVSKIISSADFSQCSYSKKS